jgi:type II secretion system protein H
MILRDPIRAENRRGGQPRPGFTLIELILVMSILTIAISLTAPALANFFRGRSLDSEARRLLALTRQGHARAASEGVPVELWIDTAQGRFGLEVEPSYEAEDPRKEEFKLDGDLRLEALNSDPSQPTFGTQLPMAMQTRNVSVVQSRHPNLPRIRFLPDGTVTEDSPQVLRLTGHDGISLEVAQSRNRLNYEIRTRVN